MVREIEQDGFRLVIDAAPQVLSLECPEEITFREEGVVLAPSVASLYRDRWIPRGFVSASLLAAKAKAFDDGLIATVELAAQSGTGRFCGKRKLLEELAARLEVGAAADLVAAALHLGSGVDASEAARKLVDGFLADDKRSKPLGFYTWSRDLESLFRQDRMLQSALPDAAAIGSLARVLHGDPVLRSGYLAWMALAERLTNPFARPDLRVALGDLDRGATPSFVEGIAIAPPSESVEGALGKRLFSDAPIPEGFSLVDLLIAEIRKGAIQLKPKETSGWYDRIAWSFETLAAPDRGPEAAKLRTGTRYRGALEALFKGILALARESHAEQLEVGDLAAAMGSDPPPELLVWPTLTVEPLPTHYLRRGLGYRFVREVLESTFGAVELRNLHRLTATGPVETPLADELAGMESLFLGAHTAACEEIGLEADPQSPDGGAALFASCVAGFGSDPDVAADNRMMVPVFYDIQRRKVKVWAFIGWTSRPLSVSFVTPPRVEVNGQGIKRRWFGVKTSIPPVVFIPGHYELVYPVTAEIYVSRLMNRDEFRAHCDRYRTQESILANLT